MVSTRTKKAKLVKKSTSALSKNQSETISKPSQPSDATALQQKKDQNLESTKPRKSSGKAEADLQTPKKLPARATRGLRGEARKEALRSTSKKPLQPVQPSSKKNRVDPDVRKPTKVKGKPTGKAKQPNKQQASPSLANEFASGVDNSEMPFDKSNTSKVPIYMQQKIEAQFDLAEVEDIYELPKSSTANEKVKKKRVRKKPLEIAIKKTAKSIPSKKPKLSAKPSKHHQGQSSALHVSRHYSDSEVAFDVFEQNFDHFDDNGNPVEENVTQMDSDAGHYLQDEFTSERQTLEEKDEQPRQYYKTPSIPKRVGSKVMKEGKVSTPRLNEKPSDPAKVPMTKANTKSPSLNDLKECCFGFDDEQDDDGDLSQASSIGGLTLSEFSPVKRSSLLPSNNCFSLIGSSSYLGHSQLSFNKPLSSRPQRFAINMSRAIQDRSQGSSFTFTAVKPKPSGTTFEDPLLINIKVPMSPKKSNKENLSIQVPVHPPVVLSFQPQSSAKAAVQDSEMKDFPSQLNPVASTEEPAPTVAKMSVTHRKRKNQLPVDISEDHDLAPTKADEGIFQEDEKEEILASGETPKESKRPIPKRSKRNPKNSSKKTSINLTSTSSDEGTSKKKNEIDQEEEIFVSSEISKKSSKEIPKKSKGNTKKASIKTATKTSTKDGAAKSGPRKMTKKNEDDENDLNVKSKAGHKKKEKQTLIYEVIGNQKQVKTWKRMKNNSGSRSLEESDPDLVGPFDSIITSNVEDRCEDAKSGIFEDDDDDDDNDDVAPKTSFQKLNKTYQRKSFIQDNPKPQQKKAEAKLQDWESKQSFHFGEIEEFDLIFK